MTAEAMAGFLGRLGHRVVRTASCYWYDLQPRFCIAFPHPRPVSPPHEEIRHVFRAARCLGVRFVGTPDAPGWPSYALIVDDPSYDVAGLSANARSKVRRGLRHCEVRRVEASLARTQGRTAHADTLQRIRCRQGPYEWHRYWDAVEATPEVEVWGALREGLLVAYLVVVVVEACAEILVARSRDDALGYYPNNALVFSAVRELVRRPGVERVLFALESLDNADGATRFKESMGFRRQRIRQRIVFHPLVERLMGWQAFPRAIRALARRRADDGFWRKLEGLLVFHGSLEARRRGEEEAAWTS